MSAADVDAAGMDGTDAIRVAAGAAERAEILAAAKRPVIECFGNLSEDRRFAITTMSGLGQDIERELELLAPGTLDAIPPPSGE